MLENRIEVDVQEQVANPGCRDLAIVAQFKQPFQSICHDTGRHRLTVLRHGYFILFLLAHFDGGVRCRQCGEGKHRRQAILTKELTGFHLLIEIDNLRDILGLRISCPRQTNKTCCILAGSNIHLHHKFRVLIMNFLTDLLDFIDDGFRHQTIRFLVLGSNAVKGIPYLQTTTRIHDSGDGRDFHIKKFSVCSIKQFGFQNILLPSNHSAAGLVVININNDVVVGEDIAFRTSRTAESILGDVVVVFQDSLELRFHKRLKVTRISCPDEMRFTTRLHHPNLNKGRTVTIRVRGKFIAGVKVVRDANDIRRINKLHAIEFLFSTLLRCRRSVALWCLGNCFCHEKTSRKIKEPYFAPWWAIQGSLTSYTIDIPHYSIIINHFECQNVDIMIIFWYNNNSS